ncbi:ATP-binding protein [Ktedonospora formicarum]|uniref:AAA+ ATPase domain-containing protein n=1 Tax=Ktedonospora formicarum TaxID=2778364 RepID=A0A8J3I0D6_9CHLR|nr:ATP-binding protein [Ktedonospora formicarum]GHO43788.1 hypothetical protein KSX_19510 [Ktedonospora formicarum]
MESLNRIIVRRRPFADNRNRRPDTNQSAPQTQTGYPRYPLPNQKIQPENRAAGMPSNFQGQRPQMPTIPQTRYLYEQEDPQVNYTEDYEDYNQQGEYDAPLRPRASGVHPPLNSVTHYPHSQRNTQPPVAPKDTYSLPQRTTYPYHHDDYGQTFHADVIEEEISEEYEDGPGLVYGGYLDEDEGENYSYTTRPGVETPRNTPVYHNYHTQRLPYPAPNAPQQSMPAPMHTRPAHITSDQQRVQPTRQTPQLPPARNHHPQLPPAPQTSTARLSSSRATQPLDPRNLDDLRQKRLEAEAYQASISREIALRPRLPQPEAQYEHHPVRSTCPRCKGAGYLRANVNFGHPNFGKPIPCSCKVAEMKDKRRTQLRELSNLDAYQDRKFQNFKSHIQGVREAFESALGFAEDPQGWLLLVGPNGCGKTHLALAIAHYRLEAGDVVLFSVVIDLLRHLRATFAPNATEVYDQLFSKMCEAGVLILDDLGAEQSSPWAKEKLFELLNYRYNMSMPTVITANPRGLQDLDERIRSRLSDISLVRRVHMNQARDYRPNHPGHEE